MLRPLLALALLGSAACAAEPRAPVVEGGIELLAPPDGDAIAVGRVGRRAIASVQLHLRNRGAAPRAVAATLEGDPAFRVPATIDLPPGVDVPLTVVVMPERLGPIEATLHLDLDEPRAFTLHAEVVERCMEAPAVVALAPIPEGCVGPPASFEVGNGCDHPIRLVTMDEGNNAIYVATRPVLPKQLAPGETTTLRVQPTPRHEGENEAAIRITDDAGAPVEIELVAVGAGRALTRDVDLQGLRPDADRLYVVDDSEAIAFHPTVLEALAEAVAADLPSLDARIGVTTTSRLAAAGCFGSGADGRLVPVDGSARRVLDRLDLLDGRLFDRLRFAGCAPGANRAFAAAERAILLTARRDDPDHEESGDGNLGLRRDGVPLQVVFVAASDDASGGSVGTWYARFAELRDRYDLRFAALVADPVRCDQAPRESRIATVVRGLGGQVLPLCGGAAALRWTPLHHDWAHQTIFPLTAVPFDRDGDGAITEAGDGFTVHAGGSRIEQLGPGGALRFTVTQTPPEVRFEPDAAPEEREVVEFAYLPICR